MHKLTIVFGPTGTVWPLMFKTEEAAKAAYALVNEAVFTADSFELFDDFAQSVRIRAGQTQGAMLEDLEVSKLAHVEHQMHVWRVQALSQQTATTDPMLRAAAARQGPAVITPQGANGFAPRF